jgi:hypothetical protein
LVVNVDEAVAVAEVAVAAVAEEEAAVEVTDRDEMDG